MNKRIRELAEQQGMTGPNFLISSHELEKFAKLIVGECIHSVEDGGGMCGATSSKKIKEYFGVE